MKQHCSLHPALLALLLVCLHPGHLASQELPGAVEGRVLSAGTGDVVPGVLLRFESGAEVLADGEGRFRVEGLAPGVHDVLLVTPDCQFSRGEVEVTPGTLHRAELFVPGVLVGRVVAPPVEERASPDGLVVTAAELEEMRAGNVTEVVRRLVPSMVGNAGGRVGEYDRLQSRTINSFMDRRPPVVVVDGVRMGNGAQALDLLRPSDVRRLEILRGAAAGWEYGSSGSAGAILVTTRRGDEAGGPRRPTPAPSSADPRRCPIPGTGADR